MTIAFDSNGTRLRPRANLEAEIARLRAALDHIRTVCDDNAPASCDKGMALTFVRDVASRAYEQTTTERTNG